MAAARAVDLLQAGINPATTRIERLPSFILVFGGPLGDPKRSARQMFLNWIDLKRRDLSEWLVKPEDYSDWNSLDGYPNLIDFERDAVCLTRAVVLFSESPGSHAELGAFCMDPVLSERLFIVISEEHYNAGSFIAKGPIRKIEDISEESICAVKGIEPLALQLELGNVVSALDAKLKTAPTTTNFDPERRRDQFLLVADLIELFGALTISKIVDLCDLLGYKTNINQVRALFAQLARFNIVTSVKKNTQKFYVPTEHRFSFLNYTALTGTARFDRIRFKSAVTLPWLQSDSKRFDAYAQIHGDGE